MIDLQHPLALLTRRLPWNQIEVALAFNLHRSIRCVQI
jgi:hypothetical protein